MSCGCGGQARGESRAAIREGGSDLPFRERKRSFTQGFTEGVFFDLRIRRRYDEHPYKNSPPCGPCGGSQPVCRLSALSPSRSSSSSLPSSPSTHPSQPCSLSSLPPGTSTVHSASTPTHTSSQPSSLTASTSLRSPVVLALARSSPPPSPSSSSSTAMPSVPSAQGTSTPLASLTPSGQHSSCSSRTIQKTGASSRMPASPAL